jgi:ribonuclease D
MQWQLVESDEVLRQLLDEKQSCEVVIVDSEFMRRNTYYPEVALLQLSFLSSGEPEDFAWLIDPLKIEDTEPLATLLESPAVLKVLHSASEDLEVFQRWLGVLPQPLFDTQRAAAMLSLGYGLGYRALVQEICSIDLPKGETRSDWLRRPLSISQCEYAALDVIWLAHVWRALHSRLLSEDKFDWVLSDGRDAVRTLATDSGGLHKRIKSAWKLDQRRLAVLAAICRWREDTARGRNRPRGWILDDQTCLKMATEDPRTVAELGNGLGVPPPVLRRYGEELLRLLARQRSVPEEDLPPPLPPPLNAPQRQQLKALRKRARELAGDLAVEPEILVTSKDIELLLRESEGETIETPVHWTGWRREAALAPLRDVLARRGA